MPQEKLSDGLPPSRIQMTQKTYPLVLVKVKGQKGQYRIRKADFDPAVHEEIKARKKIVEPTLEPPKSTTSSTLIFDKAALVTFTVEKLKTLPEYDLIEKPSHKKAALVDQLLEVMETLRE